MLKLCLEHMFTEYQASSSTKTAVKSLADRNLRTCMVEWGIGRPPCPILAKLS